MSLDKKIEAILFHKAEPMKISELARLLDIDEESIQKAVFDLQEKLQNRGIRLITKDDSLLLATAPEFGELMESITKEEFSKDLGKAALETLAVILYNGPVAKAEVDYIRGVNTSFILRSLLVRGLIERIPNPENKRGFLYRPSFDLLSHLGVERAEDMPEFKSFKEEMQQFLESIEEK